MPFNRFYQTLSLAALMSALPASGAFAADFQSVYTEINLDECLVLQADDFGASFACPGYKGYPLWIAEGDLRFFVSYGFGALDERAASQTLPQFNFLGANLEWRLTNASGAWKPFATILRWHTEAGDGSAPNGETLIITKLEPGNTCHVAYIDAKITSTANEIARDWADSLVKDFNCETDEIHYYPS